MRSGRRRELEYAGGETAKIDGLDTHLHAVPPNRYQRDIPYLTGNVVLWARPLVLFAGPNVSSEDLDVLRKAAVAAIPDALALSRSMEREALSQVCRSSLNVVSATPAEVDALRAAFRPLYAELERDEAASRAVSRIRELASEAGDGAETVRCPQASAAAAATIPPGTYRTVLTRADVEKYGLSWAEFVHVDPDPKALKAKTRETRVEFTEQGTFTIGSVLTSGELEVEWDGTYSTYRDRMKISGSDGNVITMRVQRDGKRLRFSDVKAPGPPRPPWDTHPSSRSTRPRSVARHRQHDGAGPPRVAAKSQ